MKRKTFDRTRLPTAKIYYQKQFPQLSIQQSKQEWISVQCCFHSDKHPSLRINLITGAFRCFGCDVRGGDVLAFHQIRYHLNFMTAVSYFGAWR